MAEQVGVPFYLLDYREQFQRHIVGPFLDEYARGRTPNPCVNCNTNVKFDELVKKAKMLGCRYVATGHSVKRVENARGEVKRCKKDGLLGDARRYWSSLPGPKVGPQLATTPRASR